MTPLPGKELERDRSIETGIPRTVYQAHTATAEPLEDVIVGNRLTDHPSSNQPYGPLWSIVEPVPATARSQSLPDRMVAGCERCSHVVRILTATLYTMVSAA